MSRQNLDFSDLPEELADRKMTQEEADKVVRLIDALLLFVDDGKNDKETVFNKLKEMKENTVHNVDIVLAAYEKLDNGTQ